MKIPLSMLLGRKFTIYTKFCPDIKNNPFGDKAKRQVRTHIRRRLKYEKIFFIVGGAKTMFMRFARLMCVR